MAWLWCMTRSRSP